MLPRKFFVLLIFLLSSAQTQILCPSICSNCSSNYVCTVCISRYLLVNGKCLPCPQNCLTCNQQGKCLACVSGAQLKDEKCFICSNKCNQCSNTPTNCTNCISSLTPTDGTCNLPVTCQITNCVQCQVQILSNSSSAKVCKTCLSGFYSYDVKCHPCPYPCQNCNYEINGTAVQSFINTKLKAKYPSATEIVFSTYSKWQQQNLYQIYVLDQMLTNLGNANSTAIEDKLVTLGVLNASEVDAKRLTAAEKISFLSIVTNTKYNLDNIQSRLLQQIQAAFVCTTCSSPYFVQNGACVKCSLGCLTCSSATVCTGCQNGFALISRACERCKSPCMSCYGSVTNCTDCIKPYSLAVNFICQICISSSCQKCSTNLALCDSCLSPYSYIPSASVCYRCEQDLCYQCSSSRTSQCLECYPGSALSSQKKCISCPEFCSICSINQSNSSVSCWKCKDGYTLQDGVCNSCGFGCVECSVFDKEICLYCGPRTFLNPLSICQKCPEGCEECSTYFGICIRYQPGLTSFNNQTTRCSSGCKTCSFKDPLICQQCLSSYYLSSNNCEKCSQFCIQCISSTACTKCQTNTNLVSNQCKLCEGNCATCEPTNLKSCLSCRRGYVIDEETKACSISCGSGCASCTFRDLVSTCTKCNSGFALKKDGTCIKCIQGCTGSCDPKDITKCLSCNSNSEMNKLFRCERCPAGCTSCLKSHCLSCSEGFTLTQESGKMICKQKCSYPCSTCDSTSCLKCMSGFKLSGGECEYNTTFCNPDCEYCLPGSYSSSSRCDACEIGCSTCTNSTICTACFDRYYLIDGKCKKCPSKCKTCISDTKCITCGPGYFKQVLETDSSTPTYLPNCLACSQKCKTCSFSADQCDSCQGQFSMKDSQCFGRNRVKFTFKFDRDFAQFLLASQSQVMRAKIAEILKIDKSNILITQLKSGSTILGGQISADTNAQAVTLSDELYNAVAQNNNILGYPVTEKSIIAYYDDSKLYDTSTSKVYTGIIIGCSIAVVAVIIITIIAFVCIKKRKRTKQEQKYQQKEEQGKNRPRNNFEKYEYKANLQIKEATNYLDESSEAYHGIQLYK